MRKYIASHWRGEQSLERSYWLNGVVLGIPLKILGTILGAANPSQMGVETYFALAAIYFGSVVPWGIWFSVGVIRSGSAHIRRFGRKFWARVAQILGGVNLLLMPFIIYTGIVLTWNFAQAVFGTDDLVAATMHIDQNGVLVLEGHIVFETANSFEQLLSENPETSIIQLESLGGYGGPAQRMAALIKEKELDTYTSNQCASACTLLYVSGNNRYLGTDGLLGFHQFRLDAVPDSVVATVDTGLAEIFLNRNIPQEFLDKVQTTPSSEIWVPALLELVEANFVTHIYDYKNQITYIAGEYCEKNDCSRPPESAPTGDSNF